ncbi:MAG: FAD-binding oxidoreductase [Candidatus Eisenbacteria bacterium]|nr:FAD-binding oxidoreductase [Candidatus Eisenbacteria bacterium]
MEPSAFEHPRLTRSPEVCAAYAADASGLSCTPDGIGRPHSEAEIQELVRLAGAHGEPLTAQGLRSSTTGASVAERGLALSLEKMTRLVEIDPIRRIARAEPGINLGAFKRSLRAQGLFYPPDPTSENECTLGGTVACNASGSRTYLYGPTRPWVRAIRVVLADGTAHELRRSETSKNATGYFGFQDPIDLWIGSEGTLGVITEVEVRCLPNPPGYFGALAFFSRLDAALGFVLAVDAERRSGTLAPRCLELFDSTALSLIAPEASVLRIPAGAAAAIYFEQEAEPGSEIDALEAWYAAIETAEGLADDTIIAQSDAEKSELRRLRHAIPAGMNERGARAKLQGGRKVSTDFAVPLPHLPLLMSDCFRLAEELFGGLTAGYGHVGNGHPHFNLIAENAGELARAQRAARAMTERALALGGTLSAEHGIGKLKRELLSDLYPRWLVDSMRAVKMTLDPKGLFAPGNLF